MMKLGSVNLGVERGDVVDRRVLDEEAIGDCLVIALFGVWGNVSCVCSEELCALMANFGMDLLVFSSTNSLSELS